MKSGVPPQGSMIGLERRLLTVQVFYMEGAGLEVGAVLRAGIFG